MLTNDLWLRNHNLLYLLQRKYSSQVVIFVVLLCNDNLRSGVYNSILLQRFLTMRLSLLIITITIFSNLIGALTALLFTNYCVGLKSDSWL